MAPQCRCPPVGLHPVAVEGDRAGKGEERAGGGGGGGGRESRLQTHLCALLAAPRNFRGQSIKRRLMGEAYVNEPSIEIKI